MMPNTNLVDFRYHSNTDNGLFIQAPDPFHGKDNNMTDFGAGLYLSDDKHGSYIWGARSGYSQYGTLNVYDIYTSLYNLNGIVLTDSYVDIMRWAVTTSINLGYNAKNYASMTLGKLEDRYNITVDDSDCHWILSRRTDDCMFSYLGSFFDGTMSFRGLIECYDNLSFGDELVLKTQAAIDCIEFNEVESEVFDKTPYIGQYDFLKQQSRQYFDEILNAHLVSRSDEIGVADILTYSGDDWIYYV